MASKVKKQRLDVLLFEKKLAPTRAKAQRLVMAGQVRVDGQVVIKPATKTDPKAEITVVERPKYVSRGGDKLKGAFEAFGLDVKGKVCADAGASTGGFTDCLLQNGAKKVFSIDVGFGILEWKLRNDPRVVVMERTNVRYVHTLPEPVDFVTIDVSFISLKLVIPVIRRWFGEFGGEVVALIKPQFEAGRIEVAKGDGVIRKPEVHRNVLLDVLSAMELEGFAIQGVIKSPLQGPKGNIEFLAWLAIRDNETSINVNNVINELIPNEL